MERKPPRAPYTAKDVRDLAGLSYRQLNDWDDKGALPDTDRGSSSWRRFTVHELFVVMICAELRKKFGVPLDSLRWLLRSMLADEADEFGRTVAIMGTLGVPVLLLTDLREDIQIHSALEFSEMMGRDYFGGERDAAYVVLKLNPIVNRILGSLTDPIHIDEHGAGYELIRQINRRVLARDAAERAILELVRSGDFELLEVKLRDGRVQSIWGTQEVTDLTTEGIRAVLEERRYEQITVKKQDGDVVQASRRISFKPTDDGPRVSAEQKDPARQTRRERGA